ncbi:MAG: hypothetical protein M1335_07175, partial [Chloroflexi bacterium]|nr:hypothetical protein [Chloroflexota bacterium]
SGKPVILEALRSSSLTLGVPGDGKSTSVSDIQTNDSTVVLPLLSDGMTAGLLELQGFPAAAGLEAQIETLEPALPIAAFALGNALSRKTRSEQVKGVEAEGRFIRMVVDNFPVGVIVLDGNDLTVK